jgi:hypothetical protein
MDVIWEHITGHNDAHIAAFEQMIVFSDGFRCEAICQICGYAIWTKEKIPDKRDIELATQIFRKMDTKERDRAIELFYEDGQPLIARIKKEI